MLYGRNSSIEEILDEFDLELLERYSPADRYPFPAIHIGEYTADLNTYCTSHFTNLGAVRLCATPEYIVILPAKKGEKDTFSLRYYCRHLQFNIPRSLQEKCIRPGNYKIYKYKNGICFKRYERLNDSDLGIAQ